MKTWTRKFLQRCLKPDQCDGRVVEKNAIDAKESINLPLRKWKSMSNSFDKSVLIDSINSQERYDYLKLNTAFMAGYACGWAEKSDEIK
jgi:hypothetical protein